MSKVSSNELWQAFFTEVSEQLDNLELILASNDAEAAADIHQLFRDFHTIKSSCAMMDFHSMEKIAHASEDYLDLVRKGRTQLNRTTIDHLLSGIDWLKSQLQLSRNTGQPPGENNALVETLRSLSAALTAQDKHTAQDNSNNDTGNQAEEEKLSNDEITEFASACQQELLTGLAPGAEHAKIKRSLNKLVSICNLVGFTAISTLLKKYIRQTHPLDESRANATAAGIIDRIITIENLYGVDCGATALRALFLDAMFADFAQLSGRMDYLLDLIEEQPGDRQVISQLEELLQNLSVSASLFGYSQLLNFFRYVLQTVRSIRRGDIPDRRAAFVAVRQAVDLPIAEKMQDGETASVRAELQTRLADLNYGISQAIYSAENHDAREDIASAVDIDTHTLDILMPGSLSELHHLVSEGKALCEIVIDMDCDPELMDNLVSWISGHGEIIHNRSIFASQGTAEQAFANSICFLAAFEQSIEAIEQALHNIDARRVAWRCRSVHYRSSETTGNTAVEAEKTAAKALSPATTPAAHQPQHNISTTLRIESHTLDDLVTQVGEMIMVRNMMAHTLYDKTFEDALSRGRMLLDASQQRAPDAEDIAGWKSVIAGLARTHEQMSNNNSRMQQSVNAIQNRILDLRVIPVSAVFNRIPQLVRKMAETQKKNIRLVINGKDVRIDKGMVDILMEPLIHLVRNCIDHGIESATDRLSAGKSAEATLTLSALQEGSTLVLEIADDGRGINLEKIRESAIRKGFIKPTDILTEQETCKLIFLPGFSTAEVITETSGRGVGMDVVITRINHIGGDIDVYSTPGNGTRFVMTLPLSAAIQGVIMVNANQRGYALPQSSVIEVVSVAPAALCSLYGQTAFLLRDEAMPLFRLEDLVLQKGREAGGKNSSALHFTPVAIDMDALVIVIGYGQRRIGLLVDRILGREDIFVRELHKDLRTLPAMCGAAARGNGDLVLILNSQFLMQYAERSVAAWLSQQQASA